MKKMRTSEIEYALIKYYNTRQNLIIPNVDWGFMDHECDLLIMSQAGYLTEIEIKVDKYDLINDKNKKHGHNDKKLKYLFFAIPEYLQDYIHHIPKHAGVYVIKRRKQNIKKFDVYSHWVNQIRGVKELNKYKLSIEEKYKLARLATMKLWGLKEKILNKQKEQILFF